MTTETNKLFEALASAQKQDAHLGKLLTQAREAGKIRSDKVSPNDEPFVPNRDCGSLCDIIDRSR